jgi:hypothetical protein
VTGGVPGEAAVSEQRGVSWGRRSPPLARAPRLPRCSACGSLSLQLVGYGTHRTRPGKRAALGLLDPATWRVEHPALTVEQAFD